MNKLIDLMIMSVLPPEIWSIIFDYRQQCILKDNIQYKLILFHAVHNELLRKVITFITNDGFSPICLCYSGQWWHGRKTKYNNLRWNLCWTKSSSHPKLILTWHTTYRDGCEIWWPCKNKSRKLIHK